MLNQNIVLIGGETGSRIDREYRLVFQKDTETRRVRVDSTLGLPDSVVVKHSTTGPKGAEVDRHLVQLVESFQTPNGVRQLVVNLTISVPREGVTSAHVEGKLNSLLSLLETPVNVNNQSGRTSNASVNQTILRALLLGEG